MDNGTNSNENDGLVFEVSIPGGGGTDTPPTVTLTAPAEGATIAGTTVALAATATDNLGVTRVDWFLDGGATAIASDTNASGGWTATWNSTTTADGAHTITARATDTIGQTANDTNAVTIDNVDTLPTVTLTSPAEGATIAGPLPLAATAGDDRGVTRVDWFLDGGTTAIATDTSSAGGWTATWNSTGAADGPHTIRARATDTGNQTANDTNAVTIDNVDTVPTVTLTSPAEGATIAGNAVALAATAGDDRGVTRVDWFLDGGATAIASDTNSAGGWTATWNSTSTADGPHTITARATDTGNQTANDANAVTIDNVDEVPQVTLTQPAEGATVAGTTVPLAATATDDLGVTRVDWFLDGGTTPIASDTSSAGGWTATWNSTGTSDGAHTIRARATDTTGQVANDTNDVTVDNVDELPTVTLTSPAEGAEIGGSAVALAATAGDDRGVTRVDWFLDGETTPIASDTSSADGWTATWDATSTPEGPHTITARATDTGNQTANDANAVTIDNVDELPQVTLTDPAEGATVSGDVALAATATDDVGVTRVDWFVDGGATPVASDTDRRAAGRGRGPAWGPPTDRTRSPPGRPTRPGRRRPTRTASPWTTTSRRRDARSARRGRDGRGERRPARGHGVRRRGRHKVEWFVDGASTSVATDTTAGDGWTGSGIRPRSPTVSTPSRSRRPTSTTSRHRRERFTSTTSTTRPT